MAEIVLKNLTKDFRSNEAYKTLRTNIEFSGSDKKVIVFTSCTPNEGKSTVSMGLAVSLAEGGKRVLFVDADLRKSVLMGRHRVDRRSEGTDTLPLRTGRCKRSDLKNTGTESLRNVRRTGSAEPGRTARRQKVRSLPRRCKTGV